MAHRMTMAARPASPSRHDPPRNDPTLEPLSGERGQVVVRPDRVVQPNHHGAP